MYQLEFKEYLFLSNHFVEDYQSNLFFYLHLIFHLFVRVMIINQDYYLQVIQVLHLLLISPVAISQRENLLTKGKYKENELIYLHD